MLITYVIISTVLILCYLIIIGCYIYYWLGLEVWKYPKDYVPQTKIAVVVAARNEEKGIAIFLEALLKQDYPVDLLEIWVVDDHSEDATAAIIKKYRAPHLNLIQLSEGVEGKKQAIATAIEQSQGELIVTTDADCTMNPTWLKYIVSYYEHHQPKFIAAPVSFYQEKTIFERFQTLDFMGMMAVSGAGIAGRFMSMCNGANLAYQRTAYEEVNGFEGIDHVASGDDMLLMQKIADKYPDKIGYVKHSDCQTFTHAKSTLRGFVQQRIRWTSKSGAYTGWQALFMLGTVWLLCLTMLFDFILMPWSTGLMLLFIIKFLLKGLADFFFLRMMARFFGRPKLMRYFLPALFMHWWYIAIVGTLGNWAKNYEWKGRRTK
jgi:cellulose synthase/poly-beta-1,6-N-acetylglucosamine synthase-like glycosyltransferase